MNDIDKFKIAYKNYQENYRNTYTMPIVDGDFIGEEMKEQIIEKNIDIIIAYKGQYRYSLLDGEKWVISRKKNITEKTFNILTLNKNKSVIRLQKENGDFCEFDLKDESCFTVRKQKNGKVVRRQVKSLNSFLKGYKIHNIYTEDKTYKDFLQKIKEIESNISSVSSLLKKMKEYQYIEQMLLYPNLKVKFDYRHTSSGVKKIDKRLSVSVPINDYDKDFIKFLIKNNITLDKKIENFYFDYKDTDAINLFKYIVDSKILDKISLVEKRRCTIDDLLLKRIMNWGLLNEINIQPEAFIRYIKYLVNEEMLTFDEALREVQDYYNMIYKMNNGRKYKNKYPKNLLTVIQITSKNYSRYREYYNEQMFKKEVDKKDYKQLEYKNDVYSIIRPRETQDIKDEAVQMSNCVASYINSVMDGVTKILFLRKNENIQDSIVTIEVNNNKELVQAYGACNSRPKIEELRFIREWIKEKGIENKTRWNI